MRFNSSLAQQYRKNGYLFISKSDDLGTFEIYEQKPNGCYKLVDTEWCKSDAIKRCRELAMQLKLGFDRTLDIVEEVPAIYNLRPVWENPKASKLPLTSLLDSVILKVGNGEGDNPQTKA